MEVDGDSEDLRQSSPATPEQAGSPTVSKRELPAEDEETPPPPAHPLPEVKRRRFFAQGVDDDDELSDNASVKVEELDTKAVNGKLDKGKGRAATGTQEIVEILDDTDDDEEEIIAGPSTQKAAKSKLRHHEPRDGKDFKGQKYFGSESTIAV